MFNGDKAVAKPFSLQNLKSDSFLLFLHFPLVDDNIYNICVKDNQYKYLVDDNDNFVRIIKIVWKQAGY